MGEVTRSLKVVADYPVDALLKVGFASSDRTYVNQHFGAATAFVIYGVSPEHKQLLAVTEFAELAGQQEDDKLANKLKLLDGCIAVYCRACGASAVHKLLQLGVQPVKVSEGAAIDILIGDLQEELKQGPSAWLAKAILNNQLQRPISSKETGI